LSTHFGIGFSRDIDEEKAAEQAAFQAKGRLGSNPAELIIVLSTIHYAPEKTVPIINKIFDKVRMIGCSTAGIIFSDFIETHGLAILAISSEEMKFGIGSVQNIDAHNIRMAGTVLAKNTLLDFGKHGRSIFIFFVDGLLRNSSILLKGIQEILGNVFPIVGAGSSDDFHFQKSFQIYHDKVLKSSAVGLILGGHIAVGVGERHGWRPLGKPRLITKVNENVIRTIDGKKASSLYEEYFGKKVESLRAIQLDPMSILYPLGVYVEGSNEYLLRNAVDILADGSIVCQGEVPEGAEVHIMIGNKDSCYQAATQAAQEAQRNLLGRQPQFIFIIESLTRLKLLGRMASEEIKKVKEVFGSHIPLIGMYANGEICPFQSVEKVRKPHLQNESIVVLAIG